MVAKPPVLILYVSPLTTAIQYINYPGIILTKDVCKILTFGEMVWGANPNPLYYPFYFSVILNLFQTKKLTDERCKRTLWRKQNTLLKDIKESWNKGRDISYLWNRGPNNVKMPDFIQSFHRFSEISVKNTNRILKRNLKTWCLNLYRCAKP